MATRKGKAGSGVSQATGTFGKNALAGAQGERDFADTLERLGLLDTYDSWMSVKVPSKDGTGKEAADVDIVLASGKRVLLIDVKMWSAQTRKSDGTFTRNIYWTLPFLGLPMVNLRPHKGSNGEWKLSRSMEFARARFSQALPGFTVESIVVFVPVGQRKHVPGVAFLRWPGGIKSYASGDGIRAIKSFLGRAHPTNPQAAALLSRNTVKA